MRKIDAQLKNVTERSKTFNQREVHFSAFGYSPQPRGYRCSSAPTLLAVMAYIVMAYIVMAYVGALQRRRYWQLWPI